MKYWYKPKFWIVLILNQLAAFLLSAFLATGVSIIFVLMGVHQHHMAIIVEIVGPLINLFLAYSVFCDTRNRTIALMI